MSMNTEGKIKLDRECYEYLKNSLDPLMAVMAWWASDVPPIIDDILAGIANMDYVVYVPPTEYGSKLLGAAIRMPDDSDAKMYRLRYVFEEQDCGLLIVVFKP